MESVGFSCRIFWGDFGVGIGVRGIFGIVVIYEDEFNLICVFYRMV